jgi:hypothetical protein
VEESAQVPGNSQISCGETLLEFHRILTNRETHSMTAAHGGVVSGMIGAVVQKPFSKIVPEEIV